MELQFLVLCALTAIASAGYINSNNQVYNAIDDGSSYVSSSANAHGSSYLQTGSIIHGSSFTPSSSYIPSGSLPQSNVYYQDGSNSYATFGHSEYVPEIKDGVPIDTPEVQRAKAEHFALYAKAAAAAAAASARNRGQDYYQPRKTQTYYPTTSNQYNGDYNTGYTYQVTGYPLSNSGIHAPDGYNQIGPVDTPEVQQAKAAHFAAFAKAAARTAPNKHYRYRRGLDYFLHSSNLFNSQSQHVPIITKEGVPVETPEVQAAKAQHLLAHANAKSGHTEWTQVIYVLEINFAFTTFYATGGSYVDTNNQGWKTYGTPQINQVQYSINHQNTYGGWSYQGPQHIPHLDKNGVPVETPEVQAAKQQHFLAHSQAKLNEYGLNQGWQQQNFGSYGQSHAGSSFGSSLSHQGTLITPNGVPEETPEVKIAKAQHFAAHAQEQAKHAQWAGQSGSDYGSSYSYGRSSHSHY
ncbi:hypothetical protein NQ314_005448 [Rhamnusium bicolor]|uniref:Uncharacterized protein n=1 Tax=Rhamnusium bicolor TaxID=1586634 RepID=A0AAV8ZHC0_9CUCU|nr:hypothetical protein NQ314_005448 [Rhamnusium bicolor]